MQSDNDDYANDFTKSTIYRTSGDNQLAIGFIDAEGIIYKLRWDENIRVGRVTEDRRVLRDTRFDEKELGSYTVGGVVHSHGLFEGGEIGWVEPDGTVVQAGLIFGEEEVGRVEGKAQTAAGAALLLLFLPEEQEQTNRASR